MDNEEGYEVTLDLGVRGSWATFVVAKDPLIATAMATIAARKVLVDGWYVDGVKVCKRRRHES